MISSNDIRQKYIDFFKTKGHQQIPCAPLIPENDPTVLFTTAGMHPLVPYLLGEPHPQGSRLVNYQKCLRTDDIEEIGDDTHLSFFEMLGNWSLGDYFKKSAIEWSLEFLTSPNWLNLPLTHLAVSVFAGDSDAPRDEESAKIWLSLGIPRERIIYLGKKDNWWGPAGQTGPCGPDTEMFYWTGDDAPPPNFDLNDKKWVEIWNDVFMEYEKKCKVQSAKCKVDEYEFVPLKQKNVDTGMGLERITAILQGKKNIYETELFQPIIQQINRYLPTQKNADQRAVRIITDHIRAAVFILGDEYGALPSNIGQGYVLRRLIRRMIRFLNSLQITKNILTDLAQTIIQNFKTAYPELDKNQKRILDGLKQEEIKFQKTLLKGLAEFEKNYYLDLYKLAIQKINELYPEGTLPIETPSGNAETIKTLTYYLSASPEAQENQYKNNEPKFRKLTEEMNARQRFLASLCRHSSVIKNELNQKFSEFAFTLYETYGFPWELTQDLAKEKEFNLNKDDFESAYQKHQNLSRYGAEKKFAGGLADSAEQTTRLHTATHLLQQTLRLVLGNHVQQKGSNITAERLRFDFSHPQPMTAEEIKRVEEIVNEQIQAGLEIKMEEMTVEEARQKNVIGLFPEKYGEKVKVYFIGDFSKEICGGPHVKNTKELGVFKIQKEESCGAGVRRIRAVLI